MALIPSQTLVTVTVPGYSLETASDALRLALIPFPDARIVALTLQTNWTSALFGKISLLAVVEYTPAT
ncbi:hypothetical protein [Cryobacterium roopkundense]|nr:hypothetical protein [Cryobacterium roopkundense]MBB5642905.1 hypothetical protein [Cryobacterium roopkundense]